MNLLQRSNKRPLERPFAWPCGFEDVAATGKGFATQGWTMAFALRRMFARKTPGRLRNAGQVFHCGPGFLAYSCMNSGLDKQMAGVCLGLLRRFCRPNFGPCALAVSTGGIVRMSSKKALPRLPKKLRQIWRAWVPGIMQADAARASTEAGTAISCLDAPAAAWACLGAGRILSRAGEKFAELRKAARLNPGRHGREIAAPAENWPLYHLHAQPCGERACRE